ncbi:hypothetical protein GQ457_02G021740 [Hibiscus cannabinus]
MTKLVKLRDALRKWSRSIKLKARKTTDSLKHKLEELANADPNDDNLAELLDVKIALNMEADKEELFWEQRACVNWLSKGDRNTSFFHHWASFRKKKKKIKGFDVDGRWVSDPNCLKEMTNSFFKNLFSSSNVTDGSRILDLIHPMVTDTMNKNLLSEFSSEEVYKALLSMAPLKASGEDGFPALFYQKFWYVVGEDVTRYCILALNGGINMGDINKTNIVLIQKVDTTTSMNQFRPISLCNVIYKIVAKVLTNYLIDQDTCSWKEHIVRQLFTAEQADRILCMPLSSSASTDILIWRWDKSGLYSVHSGYNFLINSSPELDEESNLQSATRNNSFFNTLWSLALPPKVKITFWRFVKNFSPTFTNLRIMKLDVETSCVLCGGEMKTNEHLALWFYRNNKVHNQGSQSIKDIASFVLSYVNDFGVSQKGSANVNSANVNNYSNDQWNPPDENHVKINFDASFNAAQRTSVSGVIVRDTNGYIMAAGSFPHSHVSDPEMAEARACEQAVSLAQDLGFRRVIFEGDALNVISKLNNLASDLSEISVILKNIHDQRSSFLSLSFLHVKRKGNEAAHLLAKEGRKFASKRVWIEEAPSCVEAAVTSDRWWVDQVA